MFRHYWITKEWIISLKARRIYLAAATASVGLFVLVIGAEVNGGVSSSFAPIFNVLLLTGVTGAAVTFVSMEYYLFTFDQSSTLRKAFWFFVMWLPLVGSALYCFRVYSRDPAFKQLRQENNGTVNGMSYK